MRLVGMLLWASRNVFPECAYGTSVMCSLMTCPSEKAWRAGMHILVWLRQSRLRGIKSFGLCQHAAFSLARDAFSGPVQFLSAPLTP